MAAELASQLEERTARRSARELGVRALGPLTILAGVAWAVAQPYRITLLDPRGHGVWELLVQPPLLVVAVGALFTLAIAPGLLDDLAAAEREERDAAAR
jgi:hypothetical protein